VTVQAAAGVALDDAYEPDDYYLDAKQIRTGQIQDRSISQGGEDVDWAYFVLNEISDVIIQTSGPSGDTVMWLLEEAWAPDYYLAYNDDANGYWSAIAYAALAPGKYYICVAAYDTTEEIPAYHLSFNATSSGHIEVTAPATGTTQFLGQTCAIGWTSDAAVTPTVDVLLRKANATVAVLASGIPNSGGCDWLVEQSIGTGYSIKIADSDNPGTYGESGLFAIAGVEADAYEPDDTVAAAKQLASGEAQRRSIDSNGADIDWAFFTLSSESEVTIETSGPAGDTRMWLYQAPVVLESPLRFNDDADGYWSRISATLSPGTYYVAVDEYGQNDAIGSYFLSLRAVSLSAPTLTVTSPTPGDVWEAGRAAMVTWTQTQLHSALVNINLYKGGTDPADLVTNIAFDVSATDGYTIWIPPASLAAGSDYQVVVSSGATSASSGEFTVIQGATGSDAYEEDDTWSQAKVLANGETQRRSIDSGGVDIDWAFFTLSAESNVVLETSGGAGDTCLWLFGSPVSLASPLAFNDDANGYWSRIAVTLSPGTYYVAVEEYSGSNEISAYDLILRHAPVSGQSIWITSPTTGQEWATGTTVGISWLSAGLGSSVDIDLLSNGMEVMSIASATANDGAFEWAIPTGLLPSTYQVRVSDPSADVSALSEQFRIIGADGDAYENDDLPEQASVISVGQTQAHSISGNGADVDWVRFTLGEAATVTITTSGAAGDTRMWLYSNPNDLAQPLAYNDDANGYWSQIEAALQPGTYYILIDEYGRNDNIPAYNLELAATGQQASSIVVTGPAGGEQWQQTTSHIITWTSAGVSGGVKVEVYRGGTLYATLSSDAPNSGRYYWNISSGMELGNDYRVRVSSMQDASVWGESPASFSIVALQSSGDAFEVDDTWNQASLLSPGVSQAHSISANGRDVDWMRFVLSSESDVRLQTSGAAGDTRMWLFSSPVDQQQPLSYNDDDGSTRWSLITQRLAAGTYYVLVDEYGNDDEIAAYGLRLDVDPVGQGVPITVSSPNGGETWRPGEARTITWSYNSDSGSTVSIELMRSGSPVMTIVASAPNTGSYSWAVPSVTAGSDYTVRVAATQASDVSDAAFTMAAPVTSGVSWTVLVYVDAENNLEAEAINDFLEMAQIGSSAQVKIVVQMDRIPGYDSRYGDWTGTKRFLVSAGMQPTAGSAVQDLGELDTGNAVTLSNFIVWGIQTYPAQKYAVVLWDHGGGVSGACWDDTSQTHLSVPDIRRALQTAAQSSGVRLNMIGFDACLMSMAEVAYEVSGYADCLVSSEEVEPGNGWPYDTVLAYANANPSATAAQFGTAIVERYIASYGSGGSETLSAVDLSKVAALKAAIDSLANTLISKMASIRGSLSGAQSAAQAYEYPTNLDVASLCDEILRRTSDTDVRTAATSLRSAAVAAVLAERHNAQRPGSSGLAIYFPASQSDYRSTYDALMMTTEGTWANMLRNYYSGPRMNDMYEPDDTPAEAATIVSGQVQTHSISALGRDVDWMRFTLSSAANVILQTSGTSGDTRLWLFAAGDLVNPLAFNDDYNGRFSRVTRDALAAGTYYVKVDEYGQNDEIPSYEVSMSATPTSGSWVEVRSPNGGERLAQGSSLLVNWATAASITGSVRVELLRGESLILSIAPAAANNGSFAWVVPYDLTLANDYVLRVTSASGVKDISDAPFSIIEGGAIQVIAPTAATVARPGTTLNIAWTSSQGVSDNVSIELLNGQSVIAMIAQKTGNDGAFSWAVPADLAEGLYTVRVRSVSDQVQGISTGAFSISSQVQPSLPGVPLNLHSSAATNVIALSWQAPASNGGSPISTYRVYRASASSGPFSPIAIVSTPSYTDSNVTQGQTYWYKVAAITAAGEGQAGEAFSATVSSTGGTSSNNTLLIIIAVVVIAIILVLAIVMVRRKSAKKGNEAYTFCPHCGAKNDGSEVCRACGKRVR
jgi:clostripain